MGLEHTGSWMLRTQTYYAVAAAAVDILLGQDVILDTAAGGAPANPILTWP
jgi:hypothetical protein